MPFVIREIPAIPSPGVRELDDVIYKFHRKSRDRFSGVQLAGTRWLPPFTVSRGPRRAGPFLKSLFYVLRRRLLLLPVREMCWFVRVVSVAIAGGATAVDRFIRSSMRWWWRHESAHSNHRHKRKGRPPADMPWHYAANAKPARSAPWRTSSELPPLAYPGQWVPPPCSRPPPTLPLMASELVHQTQDFGVLHGWIKQHRTLWRRVLW